MAGYLHTFDVGEMDSTLFTKLHIPIRHYRNDDAENARQFGAFWATMPGCGYFEEFVQVLKRVCQHRELDCESGLQTWIACGVKERKLSFATYVSLEMS